MTPQNIIDEVGEFPGIGDTKLERYILECLREMCFETWAYTEWKTFLTTAGTVEYSLTPSTSTDTILGIPHDGAQRQAVDTPNPSASNGTSGTLTPTNTYSYKVTAISNTHGETLPCTAVDHVCPATGEILLSWTAVSGASSYKVYRNDGSGGTVYGLLESVTTNSYEDDGDTSPTTSSTPPETTVLTKEIGVTNRNEMKKHNLHWRDREGDSSNLLLWDQPNRKVRLEMIPLTTNIGYQVEVALQPTVLPNTIPAVFDEVREAFINFVKGRIYRHPKTKSANYNNPAEANYHLARYRDVRNTLKLRKFQGFGGPMRVKLPRFT
jgi:hypothetical protein